MYTNLQPQFWFSNKKFFSRVYQKELLRASLIFIIAILIVFYKVVFFDYTISPASTGIAGISVNKTTEGYPLPPSHPSTFFIDPNIGYQTEANGYLAQKELFSGRIPLWNPYSGAGQPLMANFQSHAAFPLLYAFNFSKSDHFSTYFILSIFFAGLFTFLFLRELKFEFYPSVAGAFIFMFSGMFFWLYFPYAFSNAFAPALFWVAARLIKKKTVFNYALLSFFTFLSLVSGFPEISFLTIVASFIFYFYLLFGRNTTEVVKGILKYIFFSILGFGLAGYVLLPFLEYLANTAERNSGVGAYFLGSYQIITQIMPYVFAGYLEKSFKELFWANTGGYIGSVSLLFLFISFFVVGKKHIKLFLFFILGIFFVLSKSYGFPFFHLLGKLPIIKVLAFYRYSNFLLAIGFAVLTAFSLTNLERLNKKYLLLILVLFLFLLAFVGYFAVDEITISLEGQELIRKFLISAGGSFLVVISTAIAIILTINYLDRKKAVIFTLFIIFAELFFYTQIQFQRLPKENDFTKEPQYIKFLKENNDGYHRVYSINGMLMPNYNGTFKIQSIQNNDALMIDNYSEYVLKNLNPYTAAITILTGIDQNSPSAPSTAEMLKKNLPYYSFLGVKYIVSKEKLEHEHLVQVRRFEDLRIYENREAYPRVFQTQKVMHVSKNDPEKDKKRNEAILTHTAVIENNKIPKLRETNCHSESKILDYVANRVKLENSTNCEGLLILTDNYYPGWKVIVNGKEREIYLTNGLVRGIFVEPGKNEIVFSYSPASFKNGWFISLASLIIILFLIALDRKIYNFLMKNPLNRKFIKKFRSRVSKGNELVH